LSEILKPEGIGSTAGKHARCRNGVTLCPSGENVLRVESQLRSDELLKTFAVAAKRGARFREVIPISVSSVFEILQDVQPMVLTHGHSITAEEIERLVNREFTPVKYAALCNAVSWALSGRKCDSLPSFTERVNVKRKCVLKFVRYRSCGEATSN